MRVGAYDITTSAPALRSASPSLFYHTRSDTATTGEMKKTQEKSAFMQSLASYMDGIREGWRRMRGEVVKRTDIKVCVNKWLVHRVDSTYQIEHDHMLSYNSV